MQLRPYQQDSVDAIWNYFFDNYGNPVAALPTGTGKSLVIAGLIGKIFSNFPNQRVMMLTHVKELIEQNHEKLMAYWPQAPAGIYSSGLKRRDTCNQIIFGGIASVKGRHAEFGHVDLVIIDECHLVSPNQNTMYNQFIDALKTINPALKVIGLTATPYRLGQGMVVDEGTIFTDICIDLTQLDEFNKFLNEGYLAPLVPTKTNVTLDVDGVHMRGGEFIQKELQRAVDVDYVTEAALREAMELGIDRHSWLIFASGVEHAIHIAEMLNMLGVPAEAVHGGSKEHKMTGKQRDDIIARFKAGELRALVNNNVLTTGFDHPPIDMILMLRPTASPGLWVQMLGRGTRPLYAEGFDLSTTEGRLLAIQNSQKQDCLVLDYAGNTKRLGPINDPVVPRKPGKKKGEAPVKECPQCVPSTYCHASLTVCPYCGYEFPFQTKLMQAASTDELIKQEMPVIETIEVDHITYAKHLKRGQPASLQVTYYAGSKQFKEYVCVEHEQKTAKGRAERWWKTRTQIAMPDDADVALEMCPSLPIVTHLRVWTNKNYPEIMDHCFDGTGFGAHAPIMKNIATQFHQLSAESMRSMRFKKKK